MSLSAWYWLLNLACVWFGVFLASGRRRFAAYYPGGLWSIAIGGACDYLIRRHLGLWRPDLSLLSLLQISAVTYLGPRFAEGLLFMQLLPKQTSLQLPAALAWSLAALVSDWYAGRLGIIRPSPQFYAAAWLLHLLRFTALLAIYYGMHYERRAERLGLIKRQQTRRRVGEALWKLSWLPLYFGVRAVVQAMERRRHRSG